MERREIIEWIVIIACIVAWWPYLFFRYDPMWYHVLIFYISPLVLVYILVVRYRRMQEGFEFSRKIVDQQHRMTGANVLGRDSQPTGPQSPYPGIVLPSPPDESEDENEGEEEESQ